MKVDKLVNNLFKKLDNSNKGSSINYYNTNNNNHIKDDDYYLAIGSEPPRFAYYRYLRIKKCDDEYRRQTCEAAYDAITQDELDFALKRKLRGPPEEDINAKKNTGIGMNQAGPGEDWKKPDMMGKAVINLQAAFQNVDIMLNMAA